MVDEGKRGFFGRRKSGGYKEKFNSKEAALSEKRQVKMSKQANPLRAMQEEEPWAQAQGKAIAISQLKHKDQYGIEIVDPDRSNPTRHRLERPLDTIRSFERAIYNDQRDLSRRSTRIGQHEVPRAQQNHIVRHLDSPGRVPRSGSFDNASTYQDNYTQQIASPFENQRPNSDVFYAPDVLGNLPIVPGTANTNGTGSASYLSGEGVPSTIDRYSTDPSSESSSYGYRDSGNYTTSNPKPLIPGQMSYNDQQPRYVQPNIQNGITNRHSNGSIEPVSPISRSYGSASQAYAQQQQQRGEYYSHENFNVPDQMFDSLNPQEYYFPETQGSIPRSQLNVNRYSNQGSSQFNPPQAHSNFNNYAERRPVPVQQQSSSRINPTVKMFSKINPMVQPNSPTEKRKSWFRRSKSIKT